MVLKNQRGQLAIFFVLIFEILFILFAMTINVALVVHDKINFQNSLDLAALYGAKKQAEVFNALSHINYQMRQNYKLLAWRYRILGNVPFERYDSRSPQEAWCPQGEGASTSCVPSSSLQCPNTIYPSYCDAAFFVCVNTPIWDGISGNSNYCKNLNITTPGIPEDFPVIAGFLRVNAKASRLQAQASQKIENICREQKGLSHLMTHVFLTHFRLDQYHRKIMMQAIYNKTLKIDRDLDGASIHEGARKVFKKNLTLNNEKNYKRNQLTFFNSFKNKSFEEFLTPLNIFPLLQFLNLTCSSDSGYTARTTNLLYPSTITSLSGDLGTFYNDNKVFFDLNHSRPSSPHQNLEALTIGYTKKKSLTAYYAIRAELPFRTAPQLFSPRPSEKRITLKGSAFAKAFGGQIGPDKNTDQILKYQIVDLQNFSLADLERKIANIQPNYQRYPGDRWGLIDQQLHNNTDETAFLKKTTSPFTSAPTPYYLQGYFGLHAQYTQRADPLFYYNEPGKSPEEKAFHFLRIMELMAVFPNAFDIAHYSISNNYMETYFRKICKLIGQSGQECRASQAEPIVFQASDSNLPAFIRGDFGYPNSELYRRQNEQRSGINNSFVPFFFAKNANPVDLDLLGRPKVYASRNIRYSYLVLDPAHFLSSWAPSTKRDRYQKYDFPDKMFTKCYKPSDKGGAIPSGCAEGGRSGYSIKTISCDMVQTFEPQPPNLSEYCPSS